jgi:hypothetical protein
VSRLGVRSPSLVGMAGRHQPAQYRSFEAGEPIHDFEMRDRSWKLHGGEQTTEGRETPPRVLLAFSAVYEIRAAAVHTRPVARFAARTVIRSVPVWFCANLSTSM